MDVRKLLEEVKRGDTSIEEAENAFKNLPYEDLGYAKLDLHRKLRSGFPETVFCQGKPDAYLADIFETLYRENGEILGTRATPEQWNLVRARIPEIEYDPGFFDRRSGRRDSKRKAYIKNTWFAKRRDRSCILSYLRQDEDRSDRSGKRSGEDGSGYSS